MMLRRMCVGTRARFARRWTGSSCWSTHSRTLERDRIVHRHCFGGHGQTAVSRNTERSSRGEREQPFWRRRMIARLAAPRTVFVLCVGKKCEISNICGSELSFRICVPSRQHLPHAMRSNAVHPVNQEQAPGTSSKAMAVLADQARALVVKQRRLQGRKKCAQPHCYTIVARGRGEGEGHVSRVRVAVAAHRAPRSSDAPTAASSSSRASSW